MNRRGYEMNKLANKISAIIRSRLKIQNEIIKAKSEGFSYSMMEGIMTSKLIEQVKLQDLFLETYKFNYKYYKSWYSYKY